MSIAKLFTNLTLAITLFSCEAQPAYAAIPHFLDDCILHEGEDPTAEEVAWAMTETGAKTKPDIIVIKNTPKCSLPQDVVALYNVRYKVIILRQSWRTDFPNEAALLHEMRHHWQMETGKNFTRDEAECDAFLFVADYALKQEKEMWDQVYITTKPQIEKYCK